MRAKEPITRAIKRGGGARVGGVGVRGGGSYRAITAKQMRDNDIHLRVPTEIGGKNLKHVESIFVFIVYLFISFTDLLFDFKIPEYYMPCNK